MTPLTRTPLKACRSALLQGFLRSTPTSGLDEKGYVSEAIQNLIEGVRLVDFEADLRQGDGNEMEGKFRATHSSSALAVNNFAPFKASLAALNLPRGDAFASLQFERKCPHGLIGRHPPNLDVLAEGQNGVVAIESKCLEYLTPHKAVFSPAYEAEIRDERRQTSWFAEMLRLVKDPSTYRWLDAAQLVKHAFGISHTFQNRPATLLYLFWEPTNPDAYPVFSEHRSEIERFSSSIEGHGPKFSAMSYPELWDFWETHSGADWLPTHVSRLRSRYGVAI